MDEESERDFQKERSKVLSIAARYGVDGVDFRADIDRTARQIVVVLQAPEDASPEFLAEATKVSGLVRSIFTIWNPTWKVNNSVSFHLAKNSDACPP